MKSITEDIKNLLLYADAKALATFSNDDINVVPVSSIKVVENEIWLVDYFFNKTRNNIKNNPKVALTAWVGLRGYQVKASASYLTEGSLFDEAKKWISKEHPNRLVRGLVVLSPTEIFDISIHDKQL